MNGEIFALIWITGALITGLTGGVHIRFWDRDRLCKNRSALATMLALLVIWPLVWVLMDDD